MNTFAHARLGGRRTVFLPRWLSVLLTLVFAGVLHADMDVLELLPARPERYFNDYVHRVKPETAHQLDRALEGNELLTSNQVIVVLFSAGRTDAPMEEYCQRMADAWRVGQKDLKNGAVLFYFRREDKFCITARPGLQRVLPDEKRKQIIAERILPWIKAGDFDDAITHGVAAILAATQDEYKGNNHVTWLKPVTPPARLRFKDFLIPFFDISVVIYLILGYRWLSKPGLFDAVSSARTESVLTSGYYRSAGDYRYRGRSSSIGWEVGGLLLGAAVGALFSAGGSSSGGGKSFGGGGGASGDWS